MTISIITVVYNGAAYIKDCIESVLGQTYTDIEYIIIDGGSTDGTVELVQAYGDRISRFVSEPDRGLYDAMNKGVGLATGEVVGVLNADDFYPNSQIIERIMARFAETQADGVYGDIVYVDRSNTERVTRYWKSGAYRPNAFLWGWMPGHPAFFVRRRLYQEHGLFRLDMKSAADYELMLRFIHKHQATLAYLPEITTVMRAGGVSNASLANRLKANQDDRLAWKLNGLRPYALTLWIKPLRKIGQYFTKPPDTYRSK
ncbi:glycosyltransferase family 2 protein [Spirosoma luteolum]